MQRAHIAYFGPSSVFAELPMPEEEVIPGVKWGEVVAFPTPAYWAYQVIARRLESKTIRNRLGASLKEEVGACLLGGHGMPASVGLLAFEHLKKKGAFSDDVPDEEQLYSWLSEPMETNGRSLRYRFPKQKAKYLYAALSMMSSQTVPMESGKALRNWLTTIPGIGYKTASWVARNWLDADDVAILDIHILRAGLLGGFFDGSLTVERDYLALEQQFIDFSVGLNVRASELDAVIWTSMMSSPRTVQSIFEHMPDGLLKANSAALRGRPNKRHADAHQFALVG